MKCPKCHADNPDTSRFCGICASPLGDVVGPGISATRSLERSVQAASLGTIIAGKYRIVEEIGRGGMGVVYKAEDINLVRAVALKFLPPQWTSEQEARERFIHEARAASALDHPNICVIHEIGEAEGGRMFIAMACYGGENLREKIRRGPLKPDEAVGIAVQVAQGMSKAHEKGIVHRDIKPANILITSEGVAKIVDFGLAKLAGQVRLTRENSTVGTVAYMSPEQVRGEQVDQRTDIWSLGVALYEMVTARLPFKGELEQSLVHSILKSDPEPVSKVRKDLPKGLERVIYKSLMKNPSSRYQSMDELAEDLKAIAEGMKPRNAKLGLFRGRILGIKKVHVYVGLGCLAILAAVYMLVLAPKRRVYDFIAVLPLEILSKEAGQDFYSEGLADELITRFYKVAALRIAPLIAVRDYRTAKKSYKDLRRELGIKAILDPAVLRVGNRVRITAKLVDAETERPIWAESYNRDAEDILALQAEISQAIVREVKAKITPQEQAALASSQKVHPAAYDAYLRGKQLVQTTPAAITSEWAQSALGYFQQSIDLDPDFAPTYFWLVNYYEFVLMGILAPYEEVIAKAESALDKGLLRDSGSSEAHRAKGLVKFLKWEWEGACEEFKHAVELEPGDLYGHVLYTDNLHALGRFDEAIAVAKKAVELNMPESMPYLMTWLAYLLINARMYDEAISTALDGIRRQPDWPDAHFYLALAYAKKGMLNEAITKAETSLSMLSSPETDDRCLNIAIVYALANRRGDALKILDEYLAFKKVKRVQSYGISQAFAVLNEKEEAFKWLERAIQEHDLSMLYLKMDICMDNLRSDARYKEFLKRAGFKK